MGTGKSPQVLDRGVRAVRVLRTGWGEPAFVFPSTRRLWMRRVTSCNIIFSWRNIGHSPLRLEFPGTLYRVASRGNARQKIFRDDKDRKTFPGWVESGIAIMTICGAGMCENDAFSLFLLYAAVD